MGLSGRSSPGLAYVPGGWGANWRVYARDLFGTVPSRGEGGSLSTGLSGAVRNVCNCLTIGMVCVRVLLTVSHVCGAECISWVGLLGDAVVEALLVGGRDAPIPATKVEKDGCLGGDRDNPSSIHFSRMLSMEHNRTYQKILSANIVQSYSTQG